MTLDNLLRTGQLVAHTASPRELKALQHAARRSLADAQANNISNEGRYDSAYRCIMNCALLALMANGYRPDKKHVGHHQLMIQLLPKTLGTEAARIVSLDKLREKRNLIDYEGDEVDPGTMAACIEHAARLLAELEAWLAVNRKDLA
jgi:uncharacterized protein (UPF0332 family)